MSPDPFSPSVSKNKICHKLDPIGSLASHQCHQPPSPCLSPPPYLSTLLSSTTSMLSSRYSLLAPRYVPRSCSPLHSPSVSKIKSVMNRIPSAPLLPGCLHRPTPISHQHPSIFHHHAGAVRLSSTLSIIRSSLSHPSSCL